MIEIALLICGAVITLASFVATIVWAVAQVKETTSTLAIEIRHLREKIGDMAIDSKDHELRLRKIESSQHLSLEDQ